MAFCKGCGKELEEGAKFCTSCGKAVDENTENTAAGNTQDEFTKKFNEFTDTEDKTAEFEKEDIAANKVYALLSYISILFLVPLIAAPKSKYARYHANQGLTLFICEVAYNIVRGVLLRILRMILGSLLTGIISFVTGIAGVLFVVFAIVGIINAAQGYAKDLPIIGKIKILK